MSQTDTNRPAPQAGNEQKKKNKAFPIVLGLLVLAGGTFGITKYLHGQHHEETDDAQIECDISPVIPRISGYVAEVRVKDNQKVKKGDTLIIMDNRQETIQVAQMRAALEAARNNLNVAEASTQASRANVTTYQANISTIDAQIAAAEVTLKRANQDYERYSNLIKDHSITQQQFEQAEAAMLSARRQMDVLKEQRNAAQRQVGSVTTQSTATERQTGVVKANIQQREADLQNAELNLSYTVILAPQDGTVSRVSTQVGQYLQGGQTLFSVVSSEVPWVVANFKETQMPKIRPGQTVTIKVDAIPGHTFEGKVSSISPATGARFSLLPPDNATGNFVKTVQRVPVKIELARSDNFIKALRAGMNVNVDVHLD